MRKKLYSITAALSGSGDGQLPEWYLIFREGTNEVVGEGAYLVDRTAWEELRAWIAARGVDIVFDYEHQTLSDVKAPAAGWCKQWRYRDGVGIEARVEWTREAAGYLERGEYRYFSPVFHVRESDKRLVGLHSVALTNTPKTNHLKPLLAKLGAEPKQKDTEDEMLKKLIAKLALAETATEDDVLTAVDDLLNREPKEIPGEIVAALGEESGADVSTIVASIHALKQTTSTAVSRADFEALQKRLAKRDADDAVAAALAEGKITADQTEWAAKYAERDLEGFRTFVARAPVVVPLDQLPGADRSGSGDDRQASETVLAVAKMMGVTEEDLKTYGGLEQ